MEEIDWNYWLKRKKLTEIEMVLLTLGLEPENFQIDYLGVHYLVNHDDLKSKQKNYIRRMTFVQENRFSPYGYMGADGIAGNFYCASEGVVWVNRFLLWLKHEDLNWELPSELQAFIDGLNASPAKPQVQLVKQNTLTVSEQHDAQVLQAIEDLGYHPNKLPPKSKTGKRWVRADAWDLLKENSKLTRAQFENSWKRLKKDGRLIELA